MQVENSLNAAVDAILHRTTPQDSPAPAAPEPPTLMPELNDLACSGDPGAMLAALTMQSAKTQQEASRKMRDSAMSAQEKADDAAVQDMRDKANLQRVQGFVDGTMQIAQGACELGSGLNSIAGESAKADATNERDMEKPEAGYAQTSDQRSAMENYAQSREQAGLGYEKAATWDKFGASAIGAAKSGLDGALQAGITDKDADEKMHEASADAFKRIADDAHDDEKDAHDLLNKALDFYKEYVDTKNQTMMAAIHRA